MGRLAILGGEQGCGERLRQARIVGALLLEQNDERAVQRARYMTLETMAPLSDDLIISLPVAAR